MIESKEPCKRHKWKVVRETRIDFPKPNGARSGFLWPHQMLECTVCQTKDSRWKPGGAHARALAGR